MSKADLQEGSVLAANQAAVEAGISEVHTFLPGTVQSVNYALQTCEVIPGILRIKRDIEGNESDLAIPTLLDVPIVIDRGGNYGQTFPLGPGDEGILIFCERDMSAWLKSGGRRPPVTKRTHDYSDAVFMPGLVSSGNRIADYNPDDMEIRRIDGSEQRITLKDSGVIEMRTDGGFDLGDGTEDIVALLSELALAVKALEIDHVIPQFVTAAKQIELQDLADRIDTIGA